MKSKKDIWEVFSFINISQMELCVCLQIKSLD